VVQEEDHEPGDTTLRCRVKTAVAIPTQARASYLDVALDSIVPQARAAGAEVLVIDDGPSDATRAVAERHDARYVAHEAPRGLNAARNTALDATDADLVCFVDDDVEVRPGWLAALMGAARELPGEYGCLTGPIHARFEGHRFRMCGREGAPVTELDLGPHDRDAPRAWGANLAVRRSAIARAGRFAEAHQLYGDEQEWEDRLLAAGGRIRYVAAAALDHRRAGDDARLRALCRAARRRGRAARREDVAKGVIPSLRAELRVLAGCLVHGPRFACMNGPVMSAHALGRIEEALRPSPPPATPGQDDFLSGTSGTFGGLHGLLRGVADRMLDPAAGRRRRRLARADTGPARRVLVLAVERPGSRFPRARAELARSRHDVTIATTGTGARGKFENLNALLGRHDPADFDWVLVVDDDVDLPRGFLDAFLAAAREGGYVLAQPAHRLRSHAAWPHTRRRGRPGPGHRATTFVEIGPVTAFRSDAVDVLLPFPDLRMGWGLDAHWSAVARERGWSLGIVDATPVAHAQRPAGDAYPREQAIAEARAFLAGRPYVTRGEAR
jgi:GT2 family glycosyltransferase